ncbi:MAG: UDP-N-acetylmuramoyl-tripeptide--D-alanyl-D-alanine ligase [Synergistes sp.]|nr:UDP-N-acetylmuramoyl-tripeptide--D-alanyl-D-alanine ligase [Synergistes sp.]
MLSFLASDAASCSGGEYYGPNIKVSRRWRCDSREVTPGDAFAALKGAVTDGHLYVDQAIERGAKLLLVNADEYEKLSRSGRSFNDVTFITVKETQEALPAIAKEYLRLVSPRTAAITGSVGKTTTRELTAAALKNSLRVHSAVRSFNTLVGCSLTILAMPEDTEALILELGTNHFGEISEMVRTFAPEIAVITSVAPCHLEGFGSIEGVMKAKAEICESPALKAVIFNNDDPRIREFMSHNLDNIKKFSVGFSEDSELRISEARVTLDDQGPKTSAVLCRKGEEFNVSCSLFGLQHANNIGYACAAAELLGVSISEAAKGISEMMPLGGRGLCKRSASGGWVIDEAYNANPASVGAAIENVRAAAESLGLQKYAVLGGMRELGESAPEWHGDILGKVSDFDNVLLTGEEWRSCGELPENARIFSSLDEIIVEIKSIGLGGKIVLVKGSNSYGLKRVVEALTEAM